MQNRVWETFAKALPDTHRVASRLWTVGDPEQMVTPCNCIYGLVSFFATDKVTFLIHTVFPTRYSRRDGGLCETAVRNKDVSSVDAATLSTLREA